MKKRFLKKRYIGGVALLAIIAGVATWLTGCRDLSEDDVRGKLATNLEESTAYLATGVMSVESEDQIHTYLVEVGFAQPHYFRVRMHNEATGNEQVILKNDEGVFVLTPALNKQFKFQSDWPLTSSQVYLYQSLLHDLANAETTAFEVLEDHYVFTIGSSVEETPEYASQVMHFDRHKLVPSFVEVLDAEGVPRLTMEFKTFEWNTELAEDFFVASAIMELSREVMGDGIVSVVNVADALLYPTYQPDGTSLIDKTTLATAIGERVIMTFAGTHEFTIIQETARVREVYAPEVMQGEPVMVNGTVAAITDNTLTWQRNGVEFFLVSNTLDRDQMVTVAASVSGNYEK